MGLITIGQSPREDVTPALQAVLGSSIQLIEKGALDGLERAEIERLAPKPGDYVLVTRLRDGTSVKVARRLIMPKIQACIKELEAVGVDFNVLLCTGEFPRLEARKPLIMLEQLITSFACWVKGGKIGVVVPEKEQAAGAEKKWRKRGASVVVVWANPYGDVKALNSAAVMLAKENVDLIVLDCIGFTVKAWEIFRQLTGKPVLLPQFVLGYLLKSLSLM
ncbi:MAG: AroM family protein [Candidatus Bathyarchaeia archaeon]|nr:AroM family protein [Candidatus Bathyarchaeota archaeon]